MYKFGVLLALVLWSVSGWAQYFPAEGAKLHYRLVGFAAPAPPAGQECVVEVATGSWQDEEAFAARRIATATATKGKAIITVPWFGATYTWRAVYKKGGIVMKQQPLRHFSTGILPTVDTQQMRLLVTQPTQKYSGGMVFLDGMQALYDLEGHPIWYLPELEGVDPSQYVVRDLKLTNRGTITLMLEYQIYELAYDGTILWKAPNNGALSGDTCEHYHHEFTRLRNGHYMTLTREEKKRPAPPMPPAPGMDGGIDEPLRKRPPPGRHKTPTSIVVEYDQQGKVVWTWKSSGYFTDSIMKGYVPLNNAPIIDVHENAFYFDEAKRELYLSSRNLSMVLKISYPSGKVLQAYGDMPGTLAAADGKDLFCGQHSCKVSADGHLYLFNNGCDRSKPAQILLLQQPGKTGGKLQTIWQYDCHQDTASETHYRQLLQKQPTGMAYTSGGNVLELPDGNFYVSMNSECSVLFVVNKGKETLWSAVPQKWNDPQQLWEMVPQYRTHIITDSKAVDQMVLYGK